jgi:radical SAM protein with 4Fe4S-binding SPASM domain
VSYLNMILEEAFKDRDAGRFPFSFGIEVTNYCNLRCPMCPREIADRGYGLMEWDLFCKLADEAAGHPHRVIMPQGFGESFIHPRFREMIHYLHERGVHPTMVITNGTMLNEANIAALIDSQVDLVNISLDGTDKAVYEAIRKNATYEKVVANVRTLFEERKRRGAMLPHVILRMIKMEETEDDVERFEALWGPYLQEGDEIAFSNYQTWNGSVADKRVEEPVGARLQRESTPEKKAPCRMLYKTGQVYFDGRMTPCCYDYDCTMEIGNVNEASVEEIWTGERARHFRRLHEEGRADEIPICRGCQEYVP